ncbi:MAG TPA: PIG-L family deacetylase [Verrucomicrobiae bacterium]|nr:PIG-L family deacetylase [Verrucomicrobiae bacterium]
MNARQFVSRFQSLVNRGSFLKAGNISPKTRPKIPASAPRVLIFSPHPDDECIVGGLALRLLREARWNVINVAVTLGSKPERQASRRRELQNACASLGFGVVVPKEQGWPRITLESRKQNRAHWRAAVKVMAGILTEHRPRVIFIPHEQDGHPVHIGTHFLVLDALKTLPAGFRCHVIETEFWGQMAEPNLLVELSAAEVGDLVAALACHTGEVRRNPYHVRLPAWLIDNVRRGAELVGGKGGRAPDFAFGVLYRFEKWSHGRLDPVQSGQRFLSSAMNVGKYLK